MKPFSSFTKLLLGGTLTLLAATPLIGSARPFWLGTERDARVIATLNSCAPEFRNAQGACIRTNRSVMRSRSIFGGSYGSGK
jgi:hypothetical protein